MFKVLLATDGSAYALKAADFAADLCLRLVDAEITILNVIDTTPSVAMAGPLGVGVPVIVPLPEEMERFSQKILEGTRQRLQAKGSRGISRMAKGKPAEVIADTAAKENFDLVIMGCRGLGHITGMLLGSVSDKVLHRAITPVLIVRSPEVKDQ